MAYDELNRNTSWTDGHNTQEQISRGAAWVRCGVTENNKLTKFQYDSNNIFADIKKADSGMKCNAC